MTTAKIKLTPKFREFLKREKLLILVEERIKEQQGYCGGEEIRSLMDAFSWQLTHEWYLYWRAIQRKFVKS